VRVSCRAGRWIIRSSLRPPVASQYFFLLGADTRPASPGVTPPAVGATVLNLASNTAVTAGFFAGLL
jgi:hypothetical protein